MKESVKQELEQIMEDQCKETIKALDAAKEAGLLDEEESK